MKWFSFLSLLLTLSADAQIIDLTETFFENGRFGIKVTADADLVLALNEFDGDTLAATTFTTRGMALLQVGQTIEVAEFAASGAIRGFFLIKGTDLATHTLDTDGDGIDDRTELQAKPFVHPVDGTDAGNVGVYDVTTTASIADGVPGAGAGNIEASHHADIYRFSGVAGSGVFIDVTASDSALILHDYKLIDPYGQVVMASRFGLSDIGPVTLPYDGDYILLVGDADSPGTGTYAISVSVIPVPQFFNIAIGDTVSDGVPAAGAGNIEFAGAFDLYDFEGTAGQNVFVDLISSSGLTLVDYRVIAPDGTELDSSAIGLLEIATLELPQSGTYTLEVGTASSARTGIYSIAITNIPPPDMFAISIGDTVSDGIPGTGAGNIENPGVFDFYEFMGIAGQNIFVDVLTSPGLTLIDYRLIAPDDSLVASSAFGLSEIASVELPQTGTYTLEVGEANNDATGTYSIAITNIPAPDMFAIAIGDAVSNGVPGTGAGNIEVPGAYDRYSFSGTAGDVIFVDNQGQSGLATLDYRIFAPDSTELATKRFNLGDIATLQLPQTGTYTLEVGEANNDDAGTYTIQLWSVPAPDSFAIAVGDTVSDGVPGVGAGNIESPGVYDEYTFTATAGDMIFIDNQGQLGLPTMNYRILASDDSELVTKPFNFGDLGPLELPQTGTYTLEVGEANNDDTGTYTIAITSVPAPDSFAIAVGDTVSNGLPGAGAGNIETPGACDKYTFTATAGEWIFVDNQGHSGLATLDYRILAPDDSQLATRPFGFGDIGALELPQTGIYTLEVGEANNDDTGTYTIAVNPHTP